MTKLAPFRSVNELHNLLSSVWDQLFADDENVIFEAMSSHPRIGDRQTLEKVKEREKMMMNYYDFLYLLLFLLW